MEDLGIFNKVIEDSIKTTSYRSIVISSIIFLIYTLIIKLTDYYKSKNKSKPMIDMANAIKEISINVSKQNSVLDKFIQDITKKETNKIKVTIDLVLVKFKNNIESNIRETIIRNNIVENKELISANVHQFITTEYYKMISVLNMYEFNDIPISTYLKEKWIDDTYDSVLKIMYNGQSKDKRLLQVSAKLKIDIEKYNTYINNKLI